ncbi:SAM-dependent methyltransferase, partial [Escherichia coli]|nr:SAM-dependent methyltransferase [Escherichia coli]
YAIPYSDLEDLPPAEREAKLARGDALTFGHSLTELIGGQLDAGFVIDRFMEDWQPQPRFLIDRYLPTFLATRARRIG